MERKMDNRGGPWAEKIRRELYRNVEVGPSHMEMERRRLVASLGSGDPITSARSPGRRVLLPAVAGLAAAAIAAMVVLMGPLNPLDPMGEIEISGLWKVGPDDAVQKGRPMTVPENSGAKLVLPDDTTIWADGSTTLRATSDNLASFALSQGKILARVTGRPASSPFTIETPHGIVVVHGTVFSVSVNRDGMVVRLHEGRVEVRGGSEKIEMSVGQSLTVLSGITVAASPIDPAGVIEDLLITERTSMLEGPAVPLLGLSTSNAADMVPPRLRAVVSPPAIDRTGEEVEPRDEGKVRKPSIAPSVTTEEEPSPSAPIPFVDPDLEHIGVQAVDANPDDALFLEAYEEVTHGNHTSGRRLLEQYLASHPDGRYWRRVKEILGE